MNLLFFVSTRQRTLRAYFVMYFNVTPISTGMQNIKTFTNKLEWDSINRSLLKH